MNRLSDSFLIFTKVLVIQIIKCRTNSILLGTLSFLIGSFEGTFSIDL